MVELNVELEVSGMTQYPTDKTLSIRDMAADAKSTGDAIREIQEKINTDVVTKSEDIIDDLATNDSTKVLSAAQGYALNSNLSKHYAQIASQPGSDVWESVKATLNLYPNFASLSLGDSVTIAGGYAGNYSYALNFTRTEPNYQIGTLQYGIYIYPFIFDNSTNTLTH